jgi:hypothetical protein
MDSNIKQIMTNPIPRDNLINYYGLNISNNNPNLYFNHFNKMDLFNSQNILSKKRRRDDENEIINLLQDFVGKSPPFNKQNITTQQINPTIPLQAINSVGPKNQQNQIFVINQFSRNKKTDFEKTLIDRFILNRRDSNSQANISDKNANTTKNYTQSRPDNNLIENIMNTMVKVEPSQNIFSDINDILNKLNVKSVNETNQIYSNDINPKCKQVSKSCKNVVFKIEKKLK